MIPDFEKRLIDKMDQASLKELMPEFDKEQEWQRIAQKLQPRNKLLLPVWSYAAAILVLCSIAGFTWYSFTNTRQVVTKDNLPVSHGVLALNDTGNADKSIAADTLSGSKPAIAVIKKQTVQYKSNNIVRKRTANDVIYNGTPCPVELRISQIMRCPDKQPKAISSSSTLEPDQSGQLNYKENNTLGRNCSLTIKEIEIKSIATGEVILLNSNSTPSTAQQVFSYITREKQGDILAGMFNYDCDKKTRKHSLKLDNRDGNLVLE